MVTSYEATSDVMVLTSAFPIPGFGFVPVNAFVIKGSEPVLVDTGIVVQSDEFMEALRSVIDPSELRWLWLTHTDLDHVGSLQRLLADNPALRVITTYLGVGIMQLSAPLPLDRVNFVNPGESITVGDRTLTAVRPPTFDNPSTTAFHDERSGVFFSADSFGALLQSVPQSAADIPEQDLRQGQVFWATLDSPWVHSVDRDIFSRTLRAVGEAKPAMILSSHLPPAPAAMIGRMLTTIESVPGAPAFVGPDQEGLEQMLRQMRDQQAA